MDLKVTLTLVVCGTVLLMTAVIACVICYVKRTNIRIFRLNGETIQYQNGPVSARSQQKQDSDKRPQSAPPVSDPNRHILKPNHIYAEIRDSYNASRMPVIPCLQPAQSAESGPEMRPPLGIWNVEDTRNMKCLQWHESCKRLFRNNLSGINTSWNHGTYITATADRRYTSRSAEDLSSLDYSEWRSGLVSRPSLRRTRSFICGRDDKERFRRRQSLQSFETGASFIRTSGVSDSSIDTFLTARSRGAYSSLTEGMSLQSAGSIGTFFSAVSHQSHGTYLIGWNQMDGPNDGLSRTCGRVYIPKPESIRYLTERTRNSSFYTPNGFRTVENSPVIRLLTIEEASAADVTSVSSVSYENNSGAMSTQYQHTVDHDTNSDKSVLAITPLSTAYDEPPRNGHVCVSLKETIV